MDDARLGDSMYALEFWLELAERREEDPPSRRKRLAGVALTTAGVAGLALPVVPGWLLLAPGLALLNS
jgi:hypothetical protein